jgi:Rap1a immunity proteins
MKQKLILLAFLFICTEVVADNKQMAPFLTTQNLKENLNSKEKAKLISGMSYVGGIADYLIKLGRICPPEGATIVKAALIVKANLNMDPNQYHHLPAVTPVEYALEMKWYCD